MKNHNDLDELIRAALHVEQSPQQLGRLEAFWHQQSLAERWRCRIWRTAAVGAAAAAAVAASAWLWPWGATDEPLEANRSTQTAPAPAVATAAHGRTAVPSHDETLAPVAGGDSTSEEKSLSVGRPPTTYERFLFVVQTGKQAAGESASMAAVVDEVIEQVRCNPDADVEDLAKSSNLAECNVERLLLRRLLQPGDDEKHAVLRLLAVCGTRQSTPDLLRLSEREAFRDEALATIEKIVGIERLAGVVVQATDRPVRASLLRRLLAANSEPALRGYLLLVRNNALRAEALGAVKPMSGPLLEALLALLDDEDEAVRVAVAMVLGHVNGPEVTRSLIARVTQEPSSPLETRIPPEVWMALLACRGEVATEFLAYATHQPRLLGQLNRARIEWASIIP